MHWSVTTPRLFVNQVLGRWLDALQARAPGAVLQVALSHADRLPTIEAKLAAGDCDLDDLEAVDFTAAAAVQLSWLLQKLEAHARHTSALSRARGTPVELLRVQPEIPCVCAAEGGDTSLQARGGTVPRTAAPIIPILPILHTTPSCRRYTRICNSSSARSHRCSRLWG